MEKGIVLLVVGVIGLIFVYSLRPPSGFGDALMMMGQGRNVYLKEPIYLTLMALSGIISLFGVINIVKATNKENRSRSETRGYDGSSSRTSHGENFDVSFPNMPTDALLSSAQPFEENKKTMPDNPQWVPVSQKPFCNQCGVKLEADDKFCSYCGARVS